MITGAHTIIYSKHPDADRTFFRDILKLSSVNLGDNWLIFALPPSELAFHPSESNSIHEFYLMVDNIELFTSRMTAQGVGCTPIATREWGLLTELTLPGGGKLGVYQPLHARPAGGGRALHKKGKRSTEGVRARRKRR